MMDEHLYIQRLLENERLTRDLNDDSAQALIHWAIDLVKRKDFTQDDHTQRQLERVMRRISNLIGRLHDSPHGESIDRFRALVEDLKALPGFQNLALDDSVIKAYVTRARMQDQTGGFESLMDLLTAKKDAEKPLSGRPSRTPGSAARRPDSSREMGSRNRLKNNGQRFQVRQGEASDSTPEEEGEHSASARQVSDQKGGFQRSSLRERFKGDEGEGERLKKKKQGNEEEQDEGKPGQIENRSIRKRKHGLDKMD